MNTKRLLITAGVVIGVILSACGSATPEPTPTPAGNPTQGKQLYSGTCSACHGPQAKGVKGLGKDLTASEFVKTKSDLELITFLSKGRPASDPLNTTKVDMPPKGGNPALTDKDLQHIVAFMRSLQK